MPYYPPQPDRQNTEPPRNRKILRRVILCASALMILYGAVRLAGYAADLAASRRTARELRESMESTDEPAEEEKTPAQETAAETKAAPETKAEPGKETPPEQETPEQTSSEQISPEQASPEKEVQPEKLPAVPYPNGYQMVSRIQKLRRKSEYIIGWITMDGLDEPVAQKDNSFFLDHDATGRRNVNGALFMDENTGLLTRPYTILVYGHNMKTGAMFGGLKKYEDYAYCYQHRVFQFDTIYEEGQFAVFAVETISLVPGTGRYVDLAALQSTGRESRRGALKALESRSLHNLMLDVNEEDQVLLLVTCVGNDDERLIVAARRLREGEKADRLTLKNR